MCGDLSAQLQLLRQPEAERYKTAIRNECFGRRPATPAAGSPRTSSGRSQRTQGPNLDQRKETYEDAIYAIRNGGFSGAIMPQNIVVGEQADQVARFLAEYSGTDVNEPAEAGQP